LVAINGMIFIENIMMYYFGFFYSIDTNMPDFGLLFNIDTMLNYNYWIYDAIILFTIIWFYYIFIKYSRNISYFFYKHFSR